MREHQIVITLKPEQFLEVQRLARAAKAKSMGAFVRQKLLAALNIDGTSNDTDQKLALNVEASIEDLKRMHGELKIFVAESLSAYDQQPALVASDSSSEGLGGPLPDELESVAQRTFAISPRLGTFEPGNAPESFAGANDISLTSEVFSFQRDGLESAVIRDPLDQLLGNDDFLPAGPQDEEDEEDEDDDFLVANEDAQSASQITATTSNPYEDQPSRVDMSSTSAAHVFDQDHLLVQDPSLQEDHSSNPKKADRSKPAKEVESDADKSQESSPPGNAERRPPFSGGPPPKRRRV